MQKINDERDENACSGGSCVCIESCNCQGICVCEPEEDLVAKQGSCSDCTCGSSKNLDGCK